ncbi:MAG: cell division protein ZapA [Methylococcales bacterium]|nr:cell division protein ZapA [Methylococcales bacterium]
MSQKSQPLLLTIMGKEYKIACDLDEQDDLIRSAYKLDEQMSKMRDAGKVSGSDRIAVMAALNLAHELQLIKTQNALLTRTFNECLVKLSKKLENVLEKP